MLSLKKIAVTGTIGSGKSTACQLFEKIGAPHVECLRADDIVHKLLIPHTALGKKIRALLGEEIVVGNRFDRRAIAKKVFSAPPLLEKLEEAIHPEVRNAIETRFQEVLTSRPDVSLFIVEVPLLFESGLDTFFDVIIAVTADTSLSKKRYLEKGGEEEEFERRKARQMDPTYLSQKSDFTITNNGSLEDLTASCQKILNLLTTRA